MGCIGILVVLLLLVVALTALGGGGGEQAGSPEQAEQDEGVEGGGPDPEAKQPLEGERAGGQGGQQQGQPQELYQVGETATVGNVEWTVTDAYYTTELESDFGTQKRGNFVVVDFTFTNNRDEEVTLDPEIHMTLKDGTGREFGTDPDAWEFVPPRLNIFLEPVNPGISQDGRVIYEVPPDAEGFTLTVDDVEAWEDESATYDLGNLQSGTFNTASPAATATATATAGQ
jgi:hypothetical protein